MRVRRRGLIWFFGALVVLGVAQYALQYYGSSVLAQRLSQAHDWADIRVGSARFWLWGVVDLDRIRITPTARTDARLGLAPGYTINIGRLRIHRFRFGWNHGPALTSLSVAIRHVRLPAPNWDWAITVARGPTGRRRRAPTFQSMEGSPSPFDADIVLSFTEGYKRPVLQLQADVPKVARIGLQCALESPQDIDVVQNPGGLEIRHCRLNYRDRGIMRRFEARMANENHISVPELQREISGQIALDAARSHWPLLSVQAVQEFVRDPRQDLRLQMIPNEPIPLGHAFGRIWPGLPGYLGLTVTLIPSSAGRSG